MNFAGFSGATFTNAPNAGAVFLPLEPFEERARDPKKSAAAIQGALFQRFASIQEGLVSWCMPPPVRGIGTSGGFRMMVEDRARAGPQALQGAVYAMMGRAAQTPGLTQVFSLFESSTPQLYLDIDRTKVQMLGVNMADVFGALQTYLGSSYVNDFNLLGRVFRVTAQADAAFRLDPKDVLKIRVRNSSGDTVPLGSFTTVRDVSGPYRVPRYNLYPAAELDGAPAPGFSQGQAIQTHGETRRRDAAARHELRVDDARLPAAAGRQHRRFRLPAGGGVRVPGARRPVRKPDAAAGGHPDRADVPHRLHHRRRSCAGMDNNILTQVGFIVLIGLAAKNAILIVEFAKQLEDQGRDRWAAAAEAARLRLRPILMTSLAFIFGVVPLVWAIGAGAELRQALGTAVFAGMIGVTAFGLIFTPVFYVICRWLAGVARRPAVPASAVLSPGE